MVLEQRLLMAVAAALFLVGCNAANVQPDASSAAADSEPQQAETRSMPGENPEPGDAGGQQQPQAPQSQPQATGVGALSNQIDQLNGRLTLVQEQLIQLKGVSQQQVEMGQMLLTRLQHLSERNAAANVPSEGGGNADPQAQADQLDMALDQLMQLLNEMGTAGLAQAPADAYALATTYTAQGSWILVRYRTDTGETWLADGGQWVRLEEEATPSPSSYVIQLHRADQDLKGYVAVRMDRQSGRSWWLSGRSWKVYE
ncbi:MAG: hypothetical protein CMI01_16200 [Oceanospirillaceae bacterium]|nr:hypothetical protein [Oceanospirillaceae bacterium]